jgi:hypothetical protein
LRSIPPIQFERLARLPGVRLVSLQKKERTDPSHAPDCPFPVVDLSERLETFSDTAAVMKNLDLVISADTGKLRKSHEAYSSLVAGIYSTQPGFLGGQGLEEKTATNKVPLALVGQVPCKVTTENGPIHFGDLLVTSSTPGYAMKGTDRSRMVGAILGKALEPLKSGTGIIRVLVTLQ